MSGRQVGLVLIAVIAIGIAGLVFRVVSAGSQLPVLTGITPLTPGAVDRIVMENDEFKNVLTKNEIGEWWIGAYPVYGFRMLDLWETAAKFDGATLIADNPDNHAYMGVGEVNGTKLQFWQGDDMLEEFWVGDQSYAPLIEEERAIFPWSAYVRLCYLRPPDRDQVYAVFCPFPDIFQPDPESWPDPILAQIPPAEVETMTFSYPGDSFDLRVDRSVWMVTDEAEARPATAETVQEYLRTLEFGIVASGFLTQPEIDALDFSRPDFALGFGTKPGSTARSVLLLFVKKTGVERQLGAEEEGPGDYYVKDAEKPYAFVMGERMVELVLKSRADFLPAPPPAP